MTDDRPRGTPAWPHRLWAAWRLTCGPPLAKVKAPTKDAKATVVNEVSDVEMVLRLTSEELKGGLALWRPVPPMTSSVTSQTSVPG